MVKTTRKNNYVLKEKIVEIPEKLKENNQMEWVKLMNNFKIIAEEIVEKELIVDYFSVVEQNLFVFLPEKAKTDNCF